MNMNIFNIFLIFCPFINAFSSRSFFPKPFINNNHYINKQITLENNIIDIDENLFHIIEKKRTGFMNIIRYKNIMPTFFLCFSGGWVMCPSWFLLWTNVSFLVTTINTILIMSASMVINDIFDEDIDRFNMLRRPIVTGEVTKWEAVLYTFLLLSLSEFLTLHYLPTYLIDNIHFSIISLMLYTPFFKKITFIKNIFCAFFVSFSIFVGGNASCKGVLTLHPNFGLLAIIYSLIFFGSLFNEILLDIRDYEGDKYFNVKTLPSLFGKKISWIFAGLIIFYNIISNTFSLMFYRGIDNGLILPFFFIPILQQYYSIKTNDYSKESIVSTVNISSSYYFIGLLFYLFLLASI